MSSIRTHSAECAQAREDGSAQCSRYLRALFAEAPPDLFIELRLRTAVGMHCVHLAANDSIDLIEAANRRLAQLLGTDAASADPPRILRPPSFSHKHRPARLCS
jgi:hypothetical protein